MNLSDLIWNERDKLAETVSTRRILSKLSIRMLSKKAQVDRKTINKIESHRAVSFDSAMKVLSALEMEIDYVGKADKTVR